MRLHCYFAPVRFVLGLAVLLMLAGGSKAQPNVIFEFRNPAATPSDHVGLGIALSDPCAIDEVPCPDPCGIPEDCFGVVVSDTEPSFLTIITTASDRTFYALHFGLKFANEPVQFSLPIGPPVPSTSGPETILSFTSDTSPSVTVNMGFGVTNGELAMGSSGSPVFMASEAPTPGFPGAVLFQFQITSTGPVPPSVTLMFQIWVDGVAQEIHSGNHGPP
jgi:hypothetical protein